MRGTTDMDQFERFVKAVSGFPPRSRGQQSAEDVFAESFGILRDLAATSTGFARAKAWFGYALALSVQEGWPLSGFEEDQLSSEDRLRLAKELTLEATEADPFDYDVWWAHADVLMADKKFDDAVKAFENAVKLNRDEVNPNLLAEAADAMAMAGKLERADELLTRAFRRPDWHHWVKAHALFLKASRAARAAEGNYSEDERVLLDEALQQFEKTMHKPGDVGYLDDMQLLRAMIEARQSRLLARDGRFVQQAEAPRASSGSALNAFNQSYRSRKLERVIDDPGYADAEDVRYWRDAVLLAQEAANQSR